MGVRWLLYLLAALRKIVSILKLSPELREYQAMEGGYSALWPAAARIRAERIGR